MVDSNLGVLMDSSAARRRLQAIQDHLVPDGDFSSFQLRLNATAGEFFNGMCVSSSIWLSLTCSFSVLMWEKLTGVFCSE